MRKKGEEEKNKSLSYSEIYYYTHTLLPVKNSVWIYNIRLIYKKIIVHLCNTINERTKEENERKTNYE